MKYCTNFYPSIIAIGLFPIIACFFLIIIITSSDKSYGFRRLFVRMLLNIFEWASQLQYEKDVKDSETDSIKSKKHRKISSFGNIKPNNSFSKILIERPTMNYGPNTPIGLVDHDTHADHNKLELNNNSHFKKNAKSLELNSFTNNINGHINYDMIDANAIFKLKDSKHNITIIKENFHIYHVLDYVRFGIEAIIEDEVTKRFQAEELQSWNLLTRTNKSFYYISPTFTILWGLGFLVRYFLLMPIRVLLFSLGIVWLTFSSAVIGMVPESELKIWLYKRASLMCFRILARSLTAIVTFHDEENSAKPGGICVANHTSPIDVVMLSCNNCYAMIGQRHGGFFGFLQKLLSKSTHHVWFERGESQDRREVFETMKNHVSDLKKLPILIFPEGTCINNTSVMMFKKGCFEVGGVIYPAAIKYDARFGDPFWNSSHQSFVQYLLMMMTSWAIVCDIWYLPPMNIQEHENAFHFADRVKSAIAQQGGLVDLDWDGELKRNTVKKAWIDNQRYIYSQRLKTD